MLLRYVFFGDGASNQGSFHEALNLASVWKLPVLFVCINNHYGMSTHISKSMNIDDISIRASSYNMKGLALDGNDVVLVYEETLKAKEYVKTEGPMLLVLNTYRQLGHSKSDAQVYRSEDEVGEWKKRDPIILFRKYLLDEKQIPEKILRNLDNQAVQDALTFAENSPEPKIETLFDDVFADSV